MMISINSSFLHEWRTGAKKSTLPTLSMVILLVCLVWIGMGRDVQAQGTEEWIARYDAPPGNCLGCNYDYPIAIGVDGNGNGYVTGYVAMNNSGYTTTVDYATVKYDASGNQVWVARYNGPGNKQDKPTALAVDGNGNVYVTGWSYGSFSDVDYATIKYDTNGNQLWVARYNYYYQDEAYALAVDAAGNVYVTGRSIDCCSGSGSGSATVKYDASGNQLWVATYNGPGNSDTPVALSVDSYGNTYVTGYSYYGSGYNYDYATVKYDPNGSQLWVARYNGPVNLDDNATALAVDAAGNVYVTGNSEGSATHDDYVTIKYSAYSTTGSDLSITIADSPDSVTFVGESIVYTMTVTNNGPGDYSSVTVTDTLASTVSLLSATTSQGTCSGTTTITCNLGYLAGGQSANIAIAVLTTTAGMINNMASVSGDQADTDTSNNSATENTTVAIAQVEEVWGARYSG